MSIYTIISIIIYILIFLKIPLNFFFKISVFIITLLLITFHLKFWGAESIFKILNINTNILNFDHPNLYNFIKTFINAWFEEFIKMFSWISIFIAIYFYSKIYLKYNINLHSFIIKNKFNILVSIILSIITFIFIENILYIESIYSQNQFSLIYNAIYPNINISHYSSNISIFNIFISRYIYSWIFHLFFTLFFVTFTFHIISIKKNNKILWITLFFTFSIILHSIYNLLIDYKFTFLIILYHLFIIYYLFIKYDNFIINKQYIINNRFVSLKLT